MNETNNFQNQPMYQNPYVNMAGTAPKNASAPFMPPVQTRPPLRLFSLGKKDMIFVVLALVSCVFLSFFGICSGFSGGFGITAFLLFLVLAVYFLPAKKGIKPYFAVCGVLSAVLCAVFVITTNGSVRFWSVVVGFLLSIMSLYSTVADTKEVGDLSLLGFIFPPFFKGAFGKMPIAVASVFSGEGKRRKSIGGALIGALVSIPCVIIVVSLLRSSDEAFDALVSSVFDNIAADIFKVLLGVSIAIFVISYGFSLKKGNFEAKEKGGFAGIDNAVTISFMSMISVCYIAYLFSQLAYFFNAFMGILPKGYSFTVAEYARRGFFEMTAIVAINLIVIFACLLLARKKNGKVCGALRAICTFIGIFTLIIIATALSKMVLYINSFGMTILRLTTSAFMVFLAVVFIAVMLRVFMPRIRVLRTAFITAGCILALLGCINVNSVVASYNYNAYKQGTLEEIDVQTIYELDEEGVPYLIKLAESKDKDIREQAQQKIVNICDDMYDIRYKNPAGKYVKYKTDLSTGYKIEGKTYDKIGQMNIPRSIAYAQLDEYLKENPEVLMKEDEYSYEWF